MVWCNTVVTLVFKSRRSSCGAGVWTGVSTASASRGAGGSWCCRSAARGRTPCRRASREKSRRASPGCLWRNQTFTESSRRPQRHRHDACSMAWRCKCWLISTQPAARPIPEQAPERVPRAARRQERIPRLVDVAGRERDRLLARERPREEVALGQRRSNRKDVVGIHRTTFCLSNNGVRPRLCFSARLCRRGGKCGRWRWQKAAR